MVKKLLSTIISIPYKAPLPWDFLITFSGFHQINDIETVSQNIYERLFEINGKIGFIKVSCHEHDSVLNVEIFHDDNQSIPAIVQKIRQIFDLDLDVSQLKQVMLQQLITTKLWLIAPALRIVQGWNNFEVVINTIIGQVISTQQAQKFMAQIAQHCGKPVLHPYYKTSVNLFPDPIILAQADLDFLKITKMKKKTIIDVSQRIASQNLDLSDQNSNSLRENLLRVPGIGPWSAEYILLRLGHTDAFPKNDLVLNRAIKCFPDLDIDNLKPWRSYVALYLWKYYLELPVNTHHQHLAQRT